MVCLDAESEEREARKRKREKLREAFLNGTKCLRVQKDEKDAEPEAPAPATTLPFLPEGPLETTLREKLGIAEFRGRQREVIEAVLGGRDARRVADRRRQEPATSCQRCTRARRSS